MCRSLRPCLKKSEAFLPSDLKGDMSSRSSLGRPSSCFGTWTCDMVVPYLETLLLNASFDSNELATIHTSNHRKLSC